MTKSIVLLFLLSVSTIGYSQSLYTALHMNDGKEYKFGRPKQIIEENTFYSSTHTETAKNIKVFDAAGMLLTEERYTQDGILTAKLTYINDTTRHLKLARIFERWLKYGRGKEIATNQYDEHGFLIGTIDSTAHGKLIDVVKIVNNSKGDPIELVLFDANNNPFGKETAEYNYDKNTVVTSVFKNDGTKLSSDTAKIRFTPATISEEDKSNYNQYNDAISYSTKNLNGSVNLYECEYRYDKTGNWIEQKTYIITLKSNGKKERQLNKIFKREITYR
ncbi:hypothetical protein SAMN05428975_1799 [Mucilaginibacter sp. OK268]|uniref:hypothetical protein n=1 Tax=Mucilaginibacter sp. OK268 TaxID=1881048 RepID=UPI0008803825|nr:hypothetical protein [Mucilaginibacter sp. OK268]SDP55892.1 hypothetical protein SAMN05428975_1799 [Mucilaginibacter sp. OK268]